MINKLFKRTMFLAVLALIVTMLFGMTVLATDEVVSSFDISGIIYPVNNEKPVTSNIQVQTSVDGIQILKKQWGYGTSNVLGVDKTFVGGTEYRLEIIFKVKEGYTLDSNPTINVNETGYISIQKDFVNDDYNIIEISYKAKNSYKVTLHLDDVNTSLNQEYNVVSGDTFAIPEAYTSPEKFGYSFEGWYTNSSCSVGYEYNPAVPITSNTTIYAKWVFVPIRDFNINQEEVDFGEAQVGYNINNYLKSVTLKNVGNIALVYSNNNLTNFTTDITNDEIAGRIGTEYSFYAHPKNDLPVGVYNETLTITGTDVEDSTKTVAKSVNFRFEVKAATPTTYTVTLNPNGGTVTPTSKEVTQNSTYGELPIPTNTSDVTFNGWYNEFMKANLVDVYNPDAFENYVLRIGPGSTHNSGLFNAGDKIVFDVTFNDNKPLNVDINDTSISSSQYTIEDNRIYGTITLTSSNIRTGYYSDYAFFDINCEKKVNGYTINDFKVFKNSVSSNPITSTTSFDADNSITLYAGWSPIKVGAVTYTVNYDVNGGSVHGGELTTRTVASGDTFTITKLFQMPDEDYHITVHAPDNKWFDAFEISGERYEEGAKITITGNTIIKYLWKDITYVDKVELTIEAPVAGTKIEGEYDEVLKHIAHESINVRPEITLPEGADYTIESVETYWATSGDYNPYVGEIEAGKTYNAVVYVYCEDDSYQFLEEGLEVVVNGEKATTFDSQGFWVTVEYPMESVAQYLLKANVGEGVGNISVVPSGDEPDFEYPTTSVAYKENAGTKWLLAAKPNEDYRFVNWTKSGDDTFTDTNPQITIELTEDVEYLANFELIEYNVTYDANGGTGTMSGETSKYYIFPSCDYTAPSGKTFDKWEINGKTYKVGDTLTLTEDILVKATWKNKSTSSGGTGGSSSSSYKVTTKIENGTITPANASVKKNADQEFTFKANDGYEITDVLVDGKSVGVVESYKLEKVTAKHTIEVKTAKVLAIQNVDEWAKEEMNKADEKGLIPETFAKKDATKAITRLDFAAVAVKLYEAISGKKVEKAINNSFTDTNDEYVLKAYALGITKGTSETTFTPNAEITREQMATMLTRALSKAGINTEYDITNTTRFADDNELSDWGRPSVYFMAKEEIIKGIGNNRFNGLGNAKVEEAIAIALRSVDVFAK